MKKIGCEDVLTMHNLLIEYTTGKRGLRDYALLDSAIQNAFQTFDGVELYSTIIEKGGKICYSLISNHAFFDGNKRIGILAMLVFFELNGVRLKLTNEDIIYLGLNLANDKMKYDDLLQFLYKHL